MVAKPSALWVYLAPDSQALLLTAVLDQHCSKQQLLTPTRTTLLAPDLLMEAQLTCQWVLVGWQQIGFRAYILRRGHRDLDPDCQSGTVLCRTRLQQRSRPWRVLNHRTMTHSCQMRQGLHLYQLLRLLHGSGCWLVSRHATCNATACSQCHHRGIENVKKMSLTIVLGLPSDRAQICEMVAEGGGQNQMRQ